VRAESTDQVRGQQVVEIHWNCNPFRADRFEEIWRPVVEASLEYGARSFAFYRGQDDPWQFQQLMIFDDKLGFERYWFSEEVADARARAAGLFQVPVLPLYLCEVTAGSLAGAGVGE